MKRFFVARIRDGKPVPTDHTYLVVNVDEPYAAEVFRLVRDAEKAKGTWDGPEEFADFVKELTGGRWIYRYLRVDRQEIDQGPWTSRESAKWHMDEHARFGAICTGPFEVSPDYVLYKGGDE